MFHFLQNLSQLCNYLAGEVVGEALGAEVMEVELGMGQERVDFDFQNNHLFLDCSRQCNHSFHCSNYSFHHMCNPVNYTMML